jgi:FkbM family methyltransferase
MLKSLFRKSSAHAMLADIDARNSRTLARIEQFRRDGASFEEFLHLKHQFPYFGFVPCRAGSIDFVLFHANDDQIAWEYQWFGPDRYETKIVGTWLQWCEAPGTVLDIGGYTGLMATLAALAHPETRVHLFEPVDRTIERAKINVRANGVLDRVGLHNKAASNAAGTASINLYREENFVGSGNSIRDKGLPIHGTKQIDCIALDEYLPDISPTAVKIDVEGHELECLQGMSDMISRSHPKIVIETWDHSRESTLQLLRGFGYECTPFEARPRGVINYWCV